MAGGIATNLVPLVKELVQNAGKMDSAVLADIADKLSEAFLVRNDEVAILVFTEQGKFLKFLLPEKLQSIGEIPLTSTSALAARTAREKRSEIVNHFTVMRHASVFEAVPLNDERSEPIQKIMSAPILLDRKVIGVIQVCRKGKSPATAGPDFTPNDLNELIGAAEAIAPCIPLCSTD